jgi:UDP-N-acetylmuramyl pentapeptide phosphotransferase/UDP-N-acetylglucosamine-1-phosphate transferase
MHEAALAALTGAATAAISGVATGGLIPLLHRLGMLDRPNERSSHAVPTPRGGGIAPVGAVLLAVAVLVVARCLPPQMLAVLAATLGLAVVSWIDDRRGLRPAPRLAAQAVAVALGMAALPSAGGAIPAVAAGLVWVWFINLFNFMDGIDGLAGGEAAAIGAGLWLFATIGAGSDPETALFAAAIAGAAIGFLGWNWSPARIFLGDVGSVPLGYLLGFLLLGAALRGWWKIALILPLYFLADATLTLGRRLLRGERVWQAHREHFYQQAVRSGLGHAAVTGRVIAADILLIGAGWAAENGWGTAALAAATSVVAVLLIALALGR